MPVARQVVRWCSTRPVALRLRVHLNEILRKPLPRSVFPVIVAARSRIGRRRSGRIEKARQSIRFMVGDSVPDQEVERLALAYLRRTSWRAEVRIRPDLINGQEVVGLENLEQALAGGKGALLSFVHHGDYIGGFGSIVRQGPQLVLVADSGLWDPHGLLWQHQHLRALSSVPGTTVLDVAIGSAGIRQQLQGGAAVAVAIDFPGHTPTKIFGRDLMLSSGGIRIAHGADVPVVPMFSEQLTGGPLGGARVVLGEALFPKDYATPEDLHAELVRQFEKWILAWPEATEEPLRMDYRHLVRTSTQYRDAG